jgi:hypothetical protein
VKPVPVNVAELIVTGAVPVEFNVTGCVAAVFSGTSLNIRLTALSVNWGLVAAVPVPPRLTTAVLLVDESLPIVSWSVADPVVVGSNLTFNVTDWLGFKVTGNVAPDTVKSVPVNTAELIVTGAVPLEVKVTGWVDAVSTVTLPNVRLAALSVNCGLVAVVPMPLRFTTAVPLVDELLSIANCPDAGPVPVGPNSTLSVTDWLGFKVIGNVAPDIVKPLPVSVPELIVTGAGPVEVRVTGCFDEVFTLTLPNVRLFVLSVSCGLATGIPVPLRSTTAVLLLTESL